VWIAWNLFRHAPKGPTELELARLMGGLVVNAF
jgi:hypothetical protein